MLTYFEVLENANKTVPSIRKDIIERLLLEQLHWGKTELLLYGNQYISQMQYSQFLNGIDRLRIGEPLQYIVGCEWFYGRKFYINEHVLIPRPETELLVELVLQQSKHKKAVNIIDIGTGSGVIGITLKKEMPQAQVWVSDISKEALEIAKKNAKYHNVNVNCIQSDILQDINNQFDIIVSNPPYIDVNEQQVMDKSVIDFEPHLALFAQNNGVYFYEQIAKQSLKKLTNDGMIFVEIGYLQGSRISCMFKQYFSNKLVTVHKDYAGNDRMISVK